jgi:protein-tyrosine-phosphatase
VFHVLFVSRRNTARSVLAEACLNAIGKGRFKGYSCGSPRHLGLAASPAALQALAKGGIAPPGPPCQSWDLFTRNGAPHMDFVITLDEDLVSVAPSWPGQPETALWSYPDPITASDLGANGYDAMVKTLYSLRRRLELLVSLPMHTANRADLRLDVRDLGYMR